MKEPTTVKINGLWVHERWLIQRHRWFWEQVAKEVALWERYRAAERARKAAARVKEKYAA